MTVTTATGAWTEALVARPRLVERLTAATPGPVVQIVAPAGYGKSTLVQQWREQAACPFVTVALTEADDEPVRLLRRLLCALHEVGPIDVGLLHTLEVPVPDIVSFAREQVTAALDAWDHPAVLVVDDGHAVSSERSVEILRMVAARLGPEATFAFVARRRAPFPLGRVRAGRRLVEVGTADLAMNEDEAADLLGGAGLQLPPDVIRSLWRRTEGWAAGLYLAALAARDAPDPVRAVARVTGADDVVGDYLREEMLAQLAPDELELLTRTSPLMRLTGPVCDALLGRSDSAAILRRLAGSNLLIRPVPDDAGGFACHALLRGVLLERLHEGSPGAEPELHRRAAAWFDAQGDLDRATEHALAGGDLDAAGRLMWRDLPYHCSQGRTATTVHLLDGLPARRVERSPHLSMVAAAAALTMGDLPQAEAWQAAAMRALAGPSGAQEPDADALRAAALIVRATDCPKGVGQMAVDAAHAYELDHDGSPWRSFACLLRGAACHLAEDRGQAHDWLEEAVQRAAVAVPTIETVALSQLALVVGDEMGHPAAVDLVDRALRRIADERLSDYPVSALAFAVAACVHAVTGRTDEAVVELRRAERLVSVLTDYADWFLAETRLALARAGLRLGDADGARHQLAEASRLAHRVAGASLLTGWAEETWAALDDAAAIAAGDTAHLTMAELRILRFLPTHLSFREIGLRLHVSQNTVKTQARAIYRKLDASSRSEAVARARQLGLLDR